MLYLYVHLIISFTLYVITARYIIFNTNDLTDAIPKIFIALVVCILWPVTIMIAIPLSIIDSRIIKNDKIEDEKLRRIK